MRWRTVCVAALIAALLSGLAAVPASGGDSEAALWWDWMASSWIGFDGPGDPVAESWDQAAIHRDWVVWQKTTDSTLDWNIEAYNIRTRQIKSVCSAAGTQLYPSVWGNWVVWMDQRYGANSEIYAYNLASGVEKRLTNTPAIQEYMPDISGTKVTWWSPTGDVWVHDLATGTTNPLPLGAGVQLFARISGDRVVYQESSDIFVFDLRSGAINRLTNDATNDAFPDIDGTLVAWQRPGATMDIWQEDLAGGGPSLAVGLPGNEALPRVSGQYVVFAYNDGSAPHELVLYDRGSKGYAGLTSDGINLNPGLPFMGIDGLNIAYTDMWGLGVYGGHIALGRLVAPEFRWSASSGTPAYAKTVTLKGSLADNGLPLGNVALSIERSTNGGHTWSLVGTPDTNHSGSFSFTTPKNYVKSLYRVRYTGAQFAGPGTLDRLSATSPIITVNPRASVGTPKGYPSTGRKNKSYSVYGSLKPRQAVTAATAKVVAIKCYRKQSGKYKLRKTVYAKVYNYSTYSRYRASVKLPYTGKWRIRAYFKGSPINAAKHSSYKYVTVR